MIIQEWNIPSDLTWWCRGRSWQRIRQAVACAPVAAERGADDPSSTKNFAGLRSRGGWPPTALAPGRQSLLPTCAGLKFLSSPSSRFHSSDPKGTEERWDLSTGELKGQRDRSTTRGLARRLSFHRLLQFLLSSSSYRAIGEEYGSGKRTRRCV
jgi:hypothetical protein